MTRIKVRGHVTLLPRFFVSASCMVMSLGWVSAATTGWFYALDADVSVMDENAGQPVRTFTILNTTVVREYRIGKHTVLAAKMGSGCLATSVTVARVAAVRNLDFVISTGPAGALDSSRKLGDWVRVDNVLAWQMGSVMDDGEVQPSKGSEFRVNTGGDWPEGPWSEMPVIKLISGEAFVANSQVRESLAAKHKAAAVEMNSSGLLKALDGSAAKILILRVISDHADENAGDSFAAFAKSYDGEGGRMVYDLVSKLPLPLNDPSAHEELHKLLKGK